MTVSIAAHFIRELFDGGSSVMVWPEEGRGQRHWLNDPPGGPGDGNMGGGPSASPHQEATMPLGDRSFTGEQPDKNTPADNTAAEKAQAQASGEGVNAGQQATAPGDDAYRDAASGEQSLADKITEGSPARADTPNQAEG
jgi:hypothetical protein